MYILKQEQGDGIFYILNDKEYVIGRKNADLIIDNDQSISRKHAVINTKGNMITLTDCKPKYGTFHNGVQLAANKDVVLKENDIVKFGVFQSKYRIKKFPIVTTGSGLTPEQKNDLKIHLNALGGTLVNSWNDSCTFLTTHEIILTIKVLLAIIDDKPIVTPDYWKHFLQHVKTMKPLPNIADFRPPVTETLIDKVDLSFNPARKELFKGKVFVFSSDKIKKRMSPLITKTGASCISWERQELTLVEVTKSKNKYVFINDTDNLDELPRSLRELHRCVEKLGERMIPVQEIAMAVVFCSCEKDCNPKFNRIANVFKEPNITSQSEVFPLVMDTPYENGFGDVAATKNELIIPESLEVDVDILSTANTPAAVSHPQVITPESPECISSKFQHKTKRETPSTSDYNQELNETNNNVDNPSKRRRLETSTLTNLNNPTTSKVTPPKEVVPTKKRPADENLASTSKKVSLGNSLTLKSQTERRRSGETTCSEKKRANPFSLMRKDETDNPFVAFRVKTEKVDHDNPFMQMIKRPRTESAEVENITIEPTQLSLKSDISNYEPSNSSNIIWLSTSRIKIEPELTPREEEISPEILEIFERFKNTAIIEKMPSIALRTVVFHPTPASLDSSAGQKNFKKFKKVQPRHPQTTILMTSLRNPSLHEISRNSDGEEEEHVARGPPVKATSSRFVF